MAATPTNFNTNKLQIGPGTLWYFPDPPANGARIVLAADGSPDSVAHPTAKCMGLTDGGATFKTGLSEGEKVFADQIKDAIRETEGEATTSLATTIIQTGDVDLNVLLSPGQGTKVSGTGYEGVSYGSTPKTYISVALIFAKIDDPTKFSVIQLYKCSNTSGIEKAIQKNAIAKIPVNFAGLAIPSRAATDATSIEWSQV